MVLRLYNILVKIWMNQKHLEKQVGIANISVKAQYYSSELKKKMRCEKQECGIYQSYRIFIENTLAIEITMSSVKTIAAVFKAKHDKVLRKQQSLNLRLKKLFPNNNIIEEYFALPYRTDFTFKNHMLVVEIDEKDMRTGIQIARGKDKKN